MPPVAVSVTLFVLQFNEAVLAVIDTLGPAKLLVTVEVPTAVHPFEPVTVTL